MTTSEINDFREQVLDYYHQHGRHDMAWRQPPFDPYRIMVSEVMLQQTQVSRVTPKYVAFLERFPSVSVLAAAPLADVLGMWSGLGYNRRAKFLWQAAQLVIADFNGTFPQTADNLVKLPGIGRNTAGAIMAYAFNQPVVFVETNIRTVVIHHFFHDQIDVSEAAISQIVALTVDAEQPREWYWALMDYGAFLKLTVGNLNKWSKSYAKQSQFQGSKRQVRGQLLRLLAVSPRSLAELQNELDDSRLQSVIADLCQEQLVSLHDKTYQLG